MDMSFASNHGSALNDVLASPAHRVQRVLHVTETQWQVPEHGRRRAGAAARTGGPAPGAKARRPR